MSSNISHSILRFLRIFGSFKFQTTQLTKIIHNIYSSFSVGTSIIMSLYRIVSLLRPVRIEYRSHLLIIRSVPIPTPIVFRVQHGEMRLPVAAVSVRPLHRPSRSDRTARPARHAVLVGARRSAGRRLPSGHQFRQR